MKHIPYVADIHFESQAGKKLYCRVGNDPSSGVLASPELVLGNGATLKLQPASESHLDFLFQRVSDPAFVETDPTLKAFEAGGRQHTLRHALRVQAEEAKARGFWEILDEDDYTRLRNAVMNPKGTLSLDLVAFNYHPYAVAVRDATTPTAHAEPPELPPAAPAAALEPPKASNGALAQAS